MDIKQFDDAALIKAAQVKLNEEYVESMIPVFAALIKAAQVKWRNGPETEKSDIAPAKKEVLRYLDREFKAKIK